MCIPLSFKKKIHVSQFITVKLCNACHCVPKAGYPYTCMYLQPKKNPYKIKQQYSCHQYMYINTNSYTSPLSGLVMHNTADSNFPLTLNFGTFCFQKFRGKSSNILMYTHKVESSTPMFLKSDLLLLHLLRFLVIS